MTRTTYGRLRATEDRGVLAFRGMSKSVVEEQKRLEVPVTREEVYAERQAVTRLANRPIEADAERTIDMPVREELVELEKRVVVYEEVQAGKTQVQESRHVPTACSRK